MEWWQAVILGVVEGITEYLPVSSTGHLILASSLLGLDEPRVKPAMDAFNIVIQGGAILAVAGLYWPRVMQMLRAGLGIVGIGPGDAQGLRLGINILIAFLPAAVIGVMLNQIIEDWLFHAGPVLAALFLGGVYMILMDQWRLGRFSTVRHTNRERTLDDLTPGRALVIGLLQCIAMWPGTSRSMMTITGGVLVGLKPKDAAEFSFLLGLPTLGGACVYRLYKEMQRETTPEAPGMIEALGMSSIVIAFVVTTITAALAVKWLVSFLTRHGLTPFGIYRFILCAVLGLAILSGIVTIAPDEPPTTGGIELMTPAPADVDQRD